MNNFDLKDLELLGLDFNSEENRYIYNNVPVPRVTAILSKTIHEDHLMVWANKIGYKHQNYTQVLQAAAEIGNKTHKSIENYLRSGVEEPDFIPFLSFKSWWDLINKDNKISIIGMEEKLICQWFGGTYDCLLNISGSIYLIDFKSSNHISYKYFLQLSAYMYMLNLKGVRVDGCLILQLSKYKISFKEYILDFKNSDHYNFINDCIHTFSSLVYSYYRIHYTENLYTKIFKNKER